MPRSIQQLKHRTIFFDAISAAQMESAVQLLDQLPGVLASADMQRQCIAVDYWVDEYTLSQLEKKLAASGFPLFGGIRLRVLRAEIQRDEENERDELGARVLPCWSGGIFAQSYCSVQDNCVDDLTRFA